MRLRRLDILRYGAFADRSLDFGDGTNDIHLVVGANEAGKSTTLAAIGDLLWGMGERPPFAFRFPYGELRLGGIVEHDGAVLEFMRRKARTGSLLTPNEEALPDSSLAPFLGGLDRDGFDRMFGLNHERLRSGGQNMLSGREDVARVLFEAGTGLGGIGAVLSALDDEATAIFTGNARNKPLNLALKERETSLAFMRTAVMAPTKWKSIAKRLDQAVADHEDALRRTRGLEHRRSTLERMHRVRPILTKIDARTDAVERLGRIPALPSDAASIRKVASTAIAEAGISIGERKKDVASFEGGLAELAPRSAVLDHADEIVRLADGLALHRSHLTELPSARSRTRDGIAVRRQLLEDAGLPETTVVPSAALRLQARKALDAFATVEDAVKKLDRDVLAARRKVAITEQNATGMSDGTGLARLRAALGSAPRDSARSASLHAGNVETAKKRLARAFAQLAPWTGTADTLAVAVVPTADVIEAHRKRLADVAERQAKHDDLMSTARTELNDARAELVRLSNLDRQPPTPELLEQARSSRDASIVSLVAEEENGRANLADVQLGVRAADELADRREAEASRLAEYASALAAIERTGANLNDAPDLQRRLDAERLDADAEWATTWRAAGFEHSVSPQQVSGWIESRTSAMDAADALSDCQTARAEHAAEVERHRDTLCRAMWNCDLAPDPTLGLDALIEEGGSHLERLEKVRDDAVLAKTRHKEAEQALADVVDALANATSDRDQLAQTLPRVLAPLNLGELTAPAGDLAVTALDLVAQREDVDRTDAARLEDLERATALFEAELAALVAATSSFQAGDAGGQLATLRSALGSAKETERDRVRLTADRETALAEIASSEASVAAERLRITTLMETAGVTSLEALDEIIERSIAHLDLTAEIANLRDELADAAGGVSEDDLRGEVVVTSADDAAAELADVKREQQTVIEEISVLSSDMAAARADQRGAENGADAANAAQSAEEAKATIIDLGGRYVRAKSAATMLRWAINRHRETRQAPLLARAGDMLANVTGGRFSRLALDWSRGEEPVIVAERSGGERCGVDDMSEGTRDQLFLALRLAAIEEKAADHSMPLVCDDLFITADDARSARLFRQLKELSTSTQIIVFSHHDHLEKVADDAIGTGAYHVHRVQAV